MLKLQTVILILEKYSGTSKFDFWVNLEPQDHISIEQNLTKVGIYKPNITLTNLRSGEKFKSRIDSMCNYLNKIKFTELNINYVQR